MPHLAILPRRAGAILLLLAGACAPAERESAADSTAAVVAVDSLAPAAETAAERLAASTRHGEWATITAEGGDEFRAWVVYPERRDTAPVIVVIHEIFGLTTWVRAVADQLAAEGYIAIAPDLLSGEELPMPPDSLASVAGGVDSAIAVISRLDQDEVVQRIIAAGRHGMALPAGADQWGVVGFCWGGTMAYATAAGAPELGAAVAFYGGVTREQVNLLTVKAPTLGLYAENDARVNETREYVQFSYEEAGVPFEERVFPGAGHGFLRQQSAHDGANLAAARAAWPMMLQWFDRQL